MYIRYVIIHIIVHVPTTLNLPSYPGSCSCWGEPERAPPLRDCVDGISVYMYVHVYTGGHSVLRSNSKLHANFG